MDNLKKHLEELNLLEVPTYQDWLFFLGVSKTMNGIVTFFSLLKKFKYHEMSSYSYDKMSTKEKASLYKEFYNLQFLPNHLGLPTPEAYIKEKMQEDEDKKNGYSPSVMQARANFTNDGTPMFIKNDRTTPIYPASSCFRSEWDEHKALSLKVGESTRNSSSKITRVF
tara:strand:+ start:1007 stop:1510 length:504 start_codon:yes stop_codon:yes gene_type:complete